MLTMPTQRALGPDSLIMMNSNIILWLQQMRQILDEAQDFTEWVDAAQEVAYAQVEVIPVLEGISLDEKDIDEENLE